VVSNGTIRKSDGGFLQAVYCAISNRSATILRRMSLTLNRGWVSLGPSESAWGGSGRPMKAKF